MSAGARAARQRGRAAPAPGGSGATRGCSRKWSAGTLHGRFLSPAEQPYHDCGRLRLSKFGNGRATVALLRKCCCADDPHSPCLPEQVPGEAANGAG